MYESKNKFDIKCQKNNTPRESMEQFMFLFFKQKFGLNNIVVEWVYGMIESIKMHSAQDSDICLFALILRNEVDEEFSSIQSQIKTTLEEILTSIIEQANPNKTRKKIIQIIEEKKKSKLKERSVMEIVNTMYSDEHPNKEEIVNKIKDKMKEEEGKQLKESQTKSHRKTSSIKNKQNLKTNEKGILYFDLMQIILNMQLKTHFGFLRNLSINFREFDDQNYGFIDKSQLEALIIEFIGKTDIEIDYDELYSNRESYDPDIFTFSDIVNLFSNYKVEYEGDQITMLQFIFEQN